MKTNSLSIALLLTCLFTANLSFAQRLKGNGNITEKTYPVSAFNEMEIDGVFDVYLTQGNSESVKLSIDDNLLPYVKVSNDGDKLIVKWEKRKDESVNNVHSNLYITLKDITRLELHTVGKLQTTNVLRLKALKMDLHHVGSSDVELDCGQLRINYNGVGNVTLSGRAKTADIRCNGVGSLKAFDLAVDVLNLDSNGVGSAEVYAEKEISIESSGVGSVRYRGNATVKKMNASGIGKVKKTKMP